MPEQLPDGETVLLRTDFTSDDAWRATLDQIDSFYTEDSGLDLMYGFTVVDHPRFDGIGPDDLGPVLTSQNYVMLVDQRAISEPDHPVLAVDVSEFRADITQFRIAAKELGSVEVNLTLANVDFHEFGSAVDADGVYRGSGG